MKRLSPAPFMKKMSVVLLVFALVFPLFCSCSEIADNGSKPGQSAAERETLTVYIPPWGDMVERWFEVVSQTISETCGIDIERYPIPSIDDFVDGTEDHILYRDKLFAEIMAGRGPDVFLTGYSGVFLDFSKKMDSGICYDLNEFIAKDPDFDLSDYEEDILNEGIYKEKRCYIPLSYTMETLVASREKMTNHGLSAEDFSTYERFISTWENIQKKDNLRLMNITGDWEALIVDCGWLNECLNFETGTADFDLPVFRRIIDLLKTEHWLESGNGPREEFAVYEDRLFFRQIYPIQYVGAPVSNMDVDDMVILPIPNAKGNRTAQVLDFCFISSATKKAETAWIFVKALLSNEVQREIGLNLYGVPVKSSLIDETIEAKFVDKRGELDPNHYDDTFINRVKEMYHTYDNVVLCFDGGFLLYYEIRDYIQASDRQDFETFKEEIEGYFRIFMSE